MTKVQFLKTASGEELAVLSKREYERLIEQAEDAGTARLVRDARAEIAAGEVVLPKALVDRLVADENPIRVLREWRDMTQAELVTALGITQGYLSDLETGKRKGPVALHQKLARALGVPIDLLLPTEAEPARDTKRRDAVRKIKKQRRSR